MNARRTIIRGAAGAALVATLPFGLVTSAHAAASNSADPVSFPEAIAKCGDQTMRPFKTLVSPSTGQTVGYLVRCDQLNDDLETDFTFVLIPTVGSSKTRHNDAIKVTSPDTKKTLAKATGSRKTGTMTARVNGVGGGSSIRVEVYQQVPGKGSDVKRSFTFDAEAD